MLINSRVLAVQQATHFFFRMLFWLPVTAFSLLLIFNTLPYFSFNKDFIFIEERAMLFQRHLYSACFYTHISAGVFCIGTALIQFSKLILKKRKAIHIWSGRIYVFVVLLLGAPTGLYMSFFAKGTNWERALFLFMAVFWFITTLNGLRAILNKNVIAHKNWMIRSYAMALTAVTFRVYHILFYLADWNQLSNYEISLWISVIGNMLLAEYFIFRKSRSYLNSFKLISSPKNHQQ